MKTAGEIAYKVWRFWELEPLRRRIVANPEPPPPRVNGKLGAGLDFEGPEASLARFADCTGAHPR
jgi:hypothetical protein